MMTILLLDDHQISLEGTKKWLQQKYKNKLNCLTTKSLRDAYFLLKVNTIDLIISDIELNNERKNGCEFAEYTKKHYPKIKIVAFTNYCTYRVLQKALDSNFDAFLSKNIDYDEFSKAIDETLKLGCFVSSCQKRIIEKRKFNLQEMFKDSLYGLSLLTLKEIAVLKMLSITKDRKELAKRLFVSPFTIDTHIKKLREKLSLTSRSDLALFSLEFRDEIEKIKK